MEQPLRRRGRLRPRVGAAIIRESRVAEKARLFRAQPHRLVHDGAVVVRAPVRPARDERPESLLPEIAPGRELQERLDRGTGERDRMFAGMAALGRRLRGRGEKLLWQPREIFRLLEDEKEVLFVREYVLSKRGAERRQPLADLGEPRLLVRRQPCARAAPTEGG